MDLHERETLVTSDGTRLSFIRWEGGSPTFLMVHGLASNAELFGDMGARFARDGFGALAVDQRGHGLSERPSDGFDYPRNVADLVDLLESLVDHEEWRRPYLIGQSWGCSVVEEFARLHPTLTRGTILIDGGFSDLKERFPAWQDCEAQLAPPRYLNAHMDEVERAISESHPSWPTSGIAATLANLEETQDGGMRNRLEFSSHMAILRRLWELTPSLQAAQQQTPVVYVVAVNEYAGSPEVLRQTVERVRRVRMAPSSAYFIRGDHDLHAQFPERMVDIIEEEVATGVLSDSAAS